MSASDQIYLLISEHLDKEIVVQTIGKCLHNDVIQMIFIMHISVRITYVFLHDSWGPTT